MTSAWVVSSPFRPISKNRHSHRASQAVIYTDQLRHAHWDVELDLSLDLHVEPGTQDLLIYHGNDWTGRVNLFGGPQDYVYMRDLIHFSKFKPTKVFSIGIPCPNYEAQLKRKLELGVNKMMPDWAEVDLDNLYRTFRLCEEGGVIDPNVIAASDKLVIGDSHAISMYRPGWMMNSVPFKTLHGALNLGLDTFIDPITDKTGIPIRHLECYFGNIDIRHHLCRMEDPVLAAANLACRYHALVERVSLVRQLDSVAIYEPLPIEHPSRKIPKMGYYQGEPFHGTWAQRDEVRKVFNDTLRESVELHGSAVKIIDWTGPLMNDLGELSFDSMEKPKSIHLSRASYPHWQGMHYNRVSTLEEVL